MMRPSSPADSFSLSSSDSTMGFATLQAEHRQNDVSSQQKTSFLNLTKPVGTARRALAGLCLLVAAPPCPSPELLADAARPAAILGGARLRQQQLQRLAPQAVVPSPHDRLHQ